MQAYFRIGQPCILDLVRIQMQSKMAASQNVSFEGSLQINAYTKGYFSDHNCDTEKDILTSLPANLAIRCHLFFICISVRGIKSVPQPVIPLFNPSEIQLGKEDTSTPSLTAQRTLPSKVRD